jgi:hypothetical protein
VDVCASRVEFDFVCARERGVDGWGFTEREPSDLGIRRTWTLWDGVR